MAEIQKTESFYETENIMELNTTSLHALTRDKRQTIMVLFYVNGKKVFIGFIFFKLPFANFFCLHLLTCLQICASFRFYLCRLCD